MASLSYLGLREWFERVSVEQDLARRIRDLWCKIIYTNDCSTTVQKAKFLNFLFSALVISIRWYWVLWLVGRLVVMSFKFRLQFYK